MTRDAPLCPAPHRDDRPRQAADGLLLCWWHRDRLERHLAQLPALWQACEAALLGRSGTNATGPVSGSTEPSWAVCDAPSAAREHIRVELVSWVRVVLEEGPWTQAPHDRLEALSAWLVARVDWCSARPWADEMARTIADTHGEAFRAAYPDPLHRVALGPCVEDGCAGTLVATVRRSDSLLPSTIDCDHDPEHCWTADQWHALGRRMRVPLRPASVGTLVRRVLDTA